MSIAQLEQDLARNGTLISRSRRWQDHHPVFIDVVAPTNQRDDPTKCIDIGGEQISPHDAYERAKRHGDKKAAFAYVEHLFEHNLDGLENIKKKYDRYHPVIVPIVSLEKMEGGVYKYNAIPAAFATLLSSKTGWDIQGEKDGDHIIQNTKAGRTGAKKIESFIKQAYFEGPVEPGRNYVIIDDHFAKGGTIANLIDYIEHHGGKVVGASTLIASSPNWELKPTRSKIHDAKKTLGEKHFKTLHKLMFGIPSDDQKPFNAEQDCLFTWAELKSITQQAHEARRLLEAQAQKWPSKLEKQQDIIYEHVLTGIGKAIDARGEQPNAAGISAAGADGRREGEVAGRTSGDAGGVPQEDTEPERTWAGRFGKVAGIPAAIAKRLQPRANTWTDEVKTPTGGGVAKI